MSATVAIAHTKEKHRSIERVQGLVREALDLLGGIQAFVKPGQTVLVKPNLDEGCCTDPLVVRALIALALEAGAARVQVDGGGHVTAERIDLGGEEVPNRFVEIPLGKAMQRAPLPSPLLDADVIIAVPKAKTGSIDPISGAMELWTMTVNRNWREFNVGDADTIDRFADLMTVSRPDLCIVDALICGEGDGPFANQPRWCGAILACTDPVATDVAIAQLMGLDWKKLRFAEAGEARGLGARQPIVWLGVPLQEICFHAWPGHDGYDYLPVNFLVGEGVTIEGTIGHVKSAIDSLVRSGAWNQGTATLMLGDVEDPAFEEHLQQGPYLVFDDAARPEYKNDRRVHFVPGHPVLRRAMPALVKALRPPRSIVPAASKLAQVAAPAAVAALAVLGGLVGAGLRTRRTDRDEEKSRR